MPAESYDNYLRLIKLTRNASEKEIRAAITKEQRVLIQRMNSSKLELRQEAERMMSTLEAAEKILLGPEGQIIRSQQKEHTGFDSTPQVDFLMDVETIARSIEWVACNRGRKAQERRGTVRYKSAVIFHNGIDYLVEESVHKKYQTEQDRKRCSANQGDLVLFDWYYMNTEKADQGSVKTYIPGPWVTDLSEWCQSLNCELMFD